MRKQIVLGIVLFASLRVGTACGQSLNEQLFAAVSDGDKAKAEALIAKGADVNAKNNDDGRRPLHFALQGRGDTSAVVTLLIAKGADVNAKANDGRTPMHYVVYQYGQTQNDIVELLLAHGANINAKDNDGYPPIHYANESGAELLIAKGANMKDIYVKNKSKGFCSQLESLAQNGKLQAQAMDVWLAYYDDGPNCDDGQPLDDAIVMGHANTVGVLLSRGASTTSAKFDFEKIAAQFEISNSEGRAITVMVRDAIAKQRLTMAGGSQLTLQQLLDEFNRNNDSEAIRSAIIDLALKQRPAIPAEAEAAAGRGTYIFKNAKSPDEVLSAAKEYLAAIEAAPWVADYYFNLCTVLEKTPYSQQALHACKLYLVAAPDATDAGAVRQRVAGLQYAADRDKTQMKQRTRYFTAPGVEDLYRFGGITNKVSDKDIVLKLFVDWGASPPKYQVYAGCIVGDDVYGQTHDLVSTDSWIKFCEPTVNMHLVIKPEGEGFVEVSDASGGSLRATLDELFTAKQKTMAQAVLFSSSGDQGDQFYVPYVQGGNDMKHTGFAMYESDCNGGILKKDPRALPDDFIPAEKSTTGDYGRFHPEAKGLWTAAPNTDVCTRQFVSKTGYHFGEAE